MVRITGVKFKNGGKVYYFAPGNDSYERGMNVIVETANGLEYGTVVIPLSEVSDDEVVQPLKPVVRKATPKDDEQVRRNEEKRADAIASAKQKVEARGLEMKIVGCEFSFDGNKVTFYFTADGRVDFRELIKDLSALFRMRIELRQIGIRDEIKLMGGIAPCGRECCCASCMPDFNKVTIKMAKNQGLSLNPGKISGLCGRLMCCLAYENDYYAEACKNVPKVGSEVETPEGKATVINVNMLKMEVKVKIEQGDAVTYRDFAVSDIKFRRGGKDMGAENLNAQSSDGENAQDAGVEKEVAPEQDSEKHSSDADGQVESARRESARPAFRGGERKEGQKPFRTGRGDRRDRGARQGEPDGGNVPAGEKKDGGERHRDRRRGEKHGNRPEGGRPEGGRPEGNKNDGAKPASRENGDRRDRGAKQSARGDRGEKNFVGRERHGFKNKERGEGRQPSEGEKQQFKGGDGE